VYTKSGHPRLKIALLIDTESAQYCPTEAQIYKDFNMKSDTSILRGAHVIDPKQGIDAVADVVVANQRIEFVGDASHVDGEVLDLTGHYLSPGWIDIHVHTYGTLGFSDPDAIGVYQGVTTFVDAGGAGIGVLDEFVATMDGLHTSLYAGPFVRPLGLIALNFLEGEIRSLGNIPLSEWVDFMQQKRGMLRYLKCNAMGNYGPGSLKISKGLAQVLGVPLYMHIGEFQQHKVEETLAMEAFRIAEPGDMITHVYHGNMGKVVDDHGKVLDLVRRAQDRGVLFDVGYGGYNFAWKVAEQAFSQGLLPDTISSDLQQFNVVTPVKSLANVMTAMMILGMGLYDVISRVTDRAARAISLQDEAGTLAPGMPADITVFDLVKEPLVVTDCILHKRTASAYLKPLMAFKHGQRFDCDMERAKKESNWLVQYSDEKVPQRAKWLTAPQKQFLSDLVDALAHVEWSITPEEEFDYDKALELQRIFHLVRKRHVLTLKACLDSLYSSFTDHQFPIQAGLFIMCQERDLFFSRIREILANQASAEIL
jgi:dihydroorotase